MGAMISSIAMVLSATSIFLVVVLVIFIHFYTHHYRIGRLLTRRREARNHFTVEAGDPSIPTIGLNPSILLSLPISIYRSNDFEEGLECAVCLSELTDGQKARLLPHCNHGFHLECIDMWFHSHSTCPLCRCPVAGEDGLRISEPANLGLERSGLQGGRMLAISIPDRSTEMFQSSLPPLSSSRSQLEEMKSAVEDGRSPAKLKVGSLKRILSGGKTIGGSCCGSAGVSDIEQGLAGYDEENGEGSSFPKSLKIPTL